eukprot:5481723-Prymnesium_polylepis.2
MSFNRADVTSTAPAAWPANSVRSRTTWPPVKESALWPVAVLVWPWESGSPTVGLGSMLQSDNWSSPPSTVTRPIRRRLKTYMRGAPGATVMSKGSNAFALRMAAR